MWGRNGAPQTPWMRRHLLNCEFTRGSKGRCVGQRNIYMRLSGWLVFCFGQTPATWWAGRKGENSETHFFKPKVGGNYEQTLFMERTKGKKSPALRAP